MSARAALFGKLPTSLDFVRVHHDSAIAIELDTWTQQALQELLRANVAWPAASIRFVFAPPRSDVALVGILRRSRDRAGRSFPAAVFVPQLVSALTSAIAAVPDGWSRWFAAAEQLLHDTEQLPRQELPARLDALEAPTPADLQARLDAVQAELHERSSHEFVADEEAAFRMVGDGLTATNPPTDRPRAIDCPIHTADDIRAWLALTQLSLGSRALPSFFWTVPDSEGRLLLAVGAPPTQVPLWFATPGRTHARLLSVDISRLGGRGSHSVPEHSAQHESMADTFARLTRTHSG